MTDREKLVGLIQDSVEGCAEYWAGRIADHLIAHGVTVREMQKPIALEDIVETILVTPCWVEYSERHGIPSAEILDRDSVDIFRRSDKEYLPRKEYGKTWRAWVQFPSDEERKAAPWE